MYLNVGVLIRDITHIWLCIASEWRFGMERKNDMHGCCPFGNIIPGNDSISGTDILAPTLMVDCCAFGVISGSR